MTEKNRQKFLGDQHAALAKTDPALVAIKERLIYGEIAERGTLDVLGCGNAVLQDS